MDYKIICSIDGYPPRNVFAKFHALSPNNMKKNFIDVNGVFMDTSGSFRYQSDMEGQEGYITFNYIGYCKMNGLVEYTLSEKYISRYETSAGFSLYLMEEE